jgi:predicted dehydrogenase
MNKSGWNFAWPHFHWRWWWEWGGGTLADLGCHYIDLPYWALDLTSPTTISATGKVSYTGDNTTPDVMRVDYKFPATARRGVVDLTWEHGVAGPDGGKVTYKGYGAGIRFVGTKLELVADYSKLMVLRDGEVAKDFAPPEKSIPASIGHHKEWCEAIKNGGTTTCNFEYAGRLAECVLLGNVAYRAERAIAWDHATGTTDSKAADAFLSRPSRKGWVIPRG